MLGTRYGHNVIKFQEAKLKPISEKSGTRTKG